MSVILQLANVTWTQGYGASVNVNITNSGTENVKNVKIKVTDSVVFDELKVFVSLYKTCLNVFNAGSLWFYVGAAHNFELPAGNTKYIRVIPTVKSGAPIQIHNLTCDFQYTVY